jgi:hypothetical protein
MPNDPAPFSSHRSGGVSHPPEADIESIRDLLRGYGSARSILKELIQNAEDARGASRMDVFYLPGNPTAPLSLLKGPALVVANDGEFTQEHRDAITQINLGTKGTEERAIGRFGKGLKSVFAWCEAFFIIAHTDQQLGWPSPSITDFFNPWHGWRHSDWDMEFDAHADTVAAGAAGSLADTYPEGKPWLAFWFPLRCHSHATDSLGTEGWIFEEPGRLPGDDSRFYDNLCCELEALAPSLVCLRQLKQIAIVRAGDKSQDSVVLEFTDVSQRVPAPDSPVRAKKVSGQIILRNSNGVNAHRYCGLSGRLDDENRIRTIKAARDWPKVVHKRNPEFPAKGEPHFAALITSNYRNTTENQGTLETLWSVFLPVGKQPTAASKVQLPSIPQSITINLHGFFFLDSERLRIDGLEEIFSSNGTTGNKTCLEWNQFVATEGTLPHLPEALAAFAEQESLTNVQCDDLSNAFVQTWVWSNFRAVICKRAAWRPLWQGGNETWECVSSDVPVLHIPSTGDPHEVLSCIPMLGPISEAHTLVAISEEGSLPGLHNNDVSTWPEELVLKLLEDVRLGPTGDEAAAVWLNRFLAYLQGHEAMTPAIRDRASALPLLSALDARTHTPLRLCGREWYAAVEANRLFAPDNQNDGWLRLLCSALPDWHCFLANEWELPRWFIGERPRTCDNIRAARIVLTQDCLGGFVPRTKLVGAFASLGSRDAGHRLAMRFLMHSDKTHSQDETKLLFMPSTQHREQIWSRLIEQLLKNDGGADSWRLLHTEWASVLSSNLQHELGISTVDASGAWEELMKGQVDLHALEFLPDQWSGNDVSALLQGLFQAGRTRQEDTLALLRNLRLHTVRGNLSERVSVAARNGELGELFVLDTPGFEASIPTELQTLWQGFLSQTKIVEQLPPDDLASTVQEYLFGRTDLDGTTYPAKLDWNYVVRHSLETPDASEWAPLILEALRHGDQSARGLGQSLKNTKWLPLSLGERIAPNSVLHIEGLEDDLHRLLDPAKDGLAGVRALPEWVVKHHGFGTLRNYLPRIEQALEMLGLWLTDKANWHLGLSKEFSPSELEALLSPLADFENLPTAALLTKLRRIRVRGHDEGIDPLLAESVLPAILNRFDYTQGGVERMEVILRRLQSPHGRGAFDAYLAQACEDGIIEPILSDLLLVNQRGKWVPARQLIWPSTNLDPAAQLCVEQAKILTSLYPETAFCEPQTAHNQQSSSGRSSNQSSELPEFSADAAQLSKYLKPFINGNVGENLPAALVAVLGGDSKMQGLLQDLLQVRLKQRSEDFLALLLGEESDSLATNIKCARFLIEIITDRRVKAETITGDKITVELANEITTLVVGNPNDLLKYTLYRTKDRQDIFCYRLRLRSVEHPDDLADHVAVFASTIEMILLKAHCRGKHELVPHSIKDFLGKIADAGQADLRRSQLYLLDMAEARLQELGIRDVAQFERLLQQFTSARQARVDAEDMADRNRPRAQQRGEEARKLTKDAQQELQRILVDPRESGTQQALVEAVRRKMKDFTYSAESIASELFQNADDAVVELKEMKKELNPQEQQFFICFDSKGNVLEILHWGRPINQHDYSGFQDGLRRGFDQDLQKMLTLNFSDKGVHTDDGSAANVTGRFGLGFKSVFFVSDQPEVISGRLAFEIRGGFFPVPLSQNVAKEMRDKAGELGALGSVPTMIRLRSTEQTESDEVTGVIGRFTRIAPVLTIFSRQIDSITIVQDAVAKTWTKVEKKLTETGSSTNVEIGNLAFFCFRCPLRSDQYPATVLFRLDSNGISALTDDLTGVWITTPTAERAELKWALNAPFKPDTGRQRLALNNIENRTIAENVARIWAEALIELFDETSKDWKRFAEQVGLHSSATFDSWWRQLWREVTRCSPALHWESIRNGGQVLSFVAWGRTSGAMRRLIQHRAAIPSGLPGGYLKMVTGGDVRFSVSGLLAEIGNGCFAQVAGWESTQEAFPPTQTVHADISSFLEDTECTDSVEKVTLERVVAAEVGGQLQANPAIGERLGALFTVCKSVFEDSKANAAEVDHLYTWMKQIKLLASDNAYYPATELVCSRTAAGLIEKDEPLRAAFAPASSVLLPGYSDTALRFFVRARGQLKADASTLATWVRNGSLDRLPAVFEYLIEGELSQHLADQLGRPWLEMNKETQAWQSLRSAQQSELERKFAKGHLWNVTITVEPIAHELDIKQEMDAEQAFRLVSRWWQDEWATWVSRYEEKTYPAGFPGKLPWPGEDGWETPMHPSAQSRWLILFIQAALVPLGFNMIGRDQSFSQFIVSQKWLDAFARVSDEPKVLLNVLDEYLAGFVQNTKYHFQMRQFIAFYAVARNLESLLLSLKESERSQLDGAFSRVFAPNSNPALSGTGISAPPLTGMLGMGSCQVLRELYRLGRLSNPLGYPFAFTPIRKVRRLCAQLFGMFDDSPSARTSVIIFQTLSELGERLGLDPTFNRCFDLPLQILAQDRDLRSNVLKVTFEAESADDYTLDGAPERDIDS